MWWNRHTRRGYGATAAVGLLSVILVLAACTPVGEDGDDEPLESIPPEESVEADASVAPATDDGGTGEVGQLSIATGGTGGVYYPLGGGFATVISENIEGADASVQETNASVDNMLLIQSGGADLALTLGDTAADAVEGRADFEGNPIDACAIGRLYNNFTQLVTSADSGITSVEDLRGQTVSLGSPGSGTEVIALRILEAAGIDPDTDITRQQLGVDETVAALRDGTIDAGFWSGGLPTGALVDYATSGQMALVPTGDYAEPLAEEYGPFYLSEPIPADTYEGISEDVPTVVVPNVLVVSSEMPEDLQRQIAEAIYTNVDQLTDVHPAASALDAATADEIEFIDVCPGAQAFFDEQG